MSNIFANLIRKSSVSSAKVAKNRLQLVLAKERVGISEANLTEMKHELYKVISRYFDLDAQSLEIDILNKEGHSALTVNTPVSSTKG